MSKVTIEGFELDSTMICHGDILVADYLGEERILICFKSCDSELAHLYAIESNFNIWTSHGGFKSGTDRNEIETINGIKIKKVIKANTYNTVIRKCER
ncbi:MAG TPA: hypothetical protein VK190_04545 [Pseudoneobacillus sp.]|nr:hypothetical protein [Pseudoneobacillus sp.]